MSMAKKKDQYSKIAIASDAVALTFFILANIALVVGELTNVFISLGEHNPGIKFVNHYMCALVYPFLEPLVGGRTFDVVGTYLVAELVIIITAIAYRWICFILLKILSLLMI
jgi:hypothetical protein